VLLTASQRELTHGAIVPVSVVEGRLSTSHYEQEEVVEGVRALATAFGHDEFDPWYTNAPCFSALIGSGLPQQTSVGLNIISVLKYWDGGGAVSFGTVPGGETLRVNLLSANAIAGTGLPPSGFFFAVIGSGGA